MEENQANMSVTEQTTSNDTLDQTNVSQENNGSNKLHLTEHLLEMKSHKFLKKELTDIRIVCIKNME